MNKQIKFNIEKAKTGKYRIVTRSGNEIKQLVWFKDVACDGYPLFAVIDGYIHRWGLNGSYMHWCDDTLDLFLIKK